MPVVWRARTDDRADIAAVEHRARRYRREAALIGHESRAHLGDRRDKGRRLTGLGALEHRFIEAGQVKRLRGSNGRLPVVEFVAGVEHGPADRAIQQARIEMAQPVMRGQSLADGAFAGRRRSIDGDDHDKSAPKPRINSTKPGKLVAMNALSSMRTALMLASPIIKADMAMR